MGEGFKFPDVTLAQLLAAFTWAVGQLVVMGFVDSETSKVVLSVGLTVIAAAWKIADSIIRNGRAKNLALGGYGVASSSTKFSAGKPSA